MGWGISHVVANEWAGGVAAGLFLPLLHPTRRLPQVKESTTTWRHSDGAGNASPSLFKFLYAVATHRR